MAAVTSERPKKKKNRRVPYRKSKCIMRRIQKKNKFGECTATRSTDRVKDHSLRLKFFLHVNRSAYYLSLFCIHHQWIASLMILWRLFWSTGVDHDLSKSWGCIHSGWKIKSWLFSGFAVQRTGAQSQGFQSKGPHIAAPHHCLFIPLHPTWQKERNTQTNTHRERLLAVKPGLAGFSWTAVSNKVSRLKERKKKKWSTSQQSRVKRKAAAEEEQGGWMMERFCWKA